MNMLDQPAQNVLQIFKWFVLATLVGIVVGVLDAAFLKLLDSALHLRNNVPLFYLPLPFALYAIALLSRKVAKKHKDYTTDTIIQKINAYKPVSLISILKAFFLSLATMVTGGSAGKEAPCADVGAGISAFLAQLFKMPTQDQRKLMICGVSAGFAGVFGVPISGALFGLEVLWVGHIFYEVLFPALVAGITAFQVTSLLGVNYIYHALPFHPVLTELVFLKVVVAGLFFGLVSVLFIEISKFARVFFRFITTRTNLFWTCMLGVLLLVLIGFTVSPLYLGLGMPGIDGPLSGNPLESPFGFLYKIITTSITLAAGGIGGAVTPIFFVGAQAGATLSAFLQVDSATLAAIGLVAVLAGTANTPLAASVMAIELFGPGIAPYAMVACVISFLITGHQSIYPHQRISMDSGKELEHADTRPHLMRRATDRKQYMPHRKALLNQVKNSAKHYWPNSHKRKK